MQPDPWSELPGPEPAQKPQVSTRLLFAIILSGFVCLFVGGITVFSMIFDLGPEISQRAATLQASPMPTADSTGTAIALSQYEIQEALPLDAQPVLVDGFDSNTNLWQTVVEHGQTGYSVGTVEEGHYTYVVSGNVSNRYWWSLPETQGDAPSSLYLTVDARQTGGDPDSGYGLVLNASSSEAGWIAFQIAENGYFRVVTERDYTLEGDWTRLEGIRRGEWNRLTVRVEDGYAQFFVNKVLVHEAYDVDTTRGGPGVIASSLDVEAQMFQFDNFALYSLED